jgi:2-polyprenyl-3-methyl-5-hydroxy-6-metoxy-1,4-benzoquinol methylase
MAKKFVKPRERHVPKPIAVKSPESDLRRLNQEVKTIWNRNADFWDQQMGEGNDFHKSLIEPAQLELLKVAEGTVILDAACGNGQFARKLAELGAHVTAIDASDRMIAHAKSRSKDCQGQIEYRVIDCTDRQQLTKLGEKRFDHVVCTMALMDMTEIEPLISAAAELLKPGGSFVFSLLHPCFNSGIAKQGMEQHDIGGELVREFFVRVSRYSRSATTKGLAMRGQPVAQYYFHRSMTDLLQPFFSAGFVLDGLREPSFPPKAGSKGLFEMVFQEIPPALVARMRLP